MPGGTAADARVGATKRGVRLDERRIQPLTGRHAAALTDTTIGGQLGYVAGRNALRFGLHNRLVNKGRIGDRRLRPPQPAGAIGCATGREGQD